MKLNMSSVIAKGVMAPQGLRATFKRGIAAVENQQPAERADPSETDKSDTGDGRADGGLILGH